uniref:Uncharacterized protein n=1 Tax=Medicago truncatula TaxID=3880 RepID=I3SEL1_MEDTR|nr:unknown [Medicago truncatula]
MTMEEAQKIIMTQGSSTKMLFLKQSLPTVSKGLHTRTKLAQKLHQKHTRIIHKANINTHRRSVTCQLGQLSILTPIHTANRARMICLTILLPLLTQNCCRLNLNLVQLVLQQ